MIKVVVDTNVFVSVMLGGEVSLNLYKQLAEGKFSVIISPEILNELLYVISRPKFNFDTIHCNKVINFLKKKAKFVYPEEKISLCRDIKDNIFLECALAGKADFIVTGDKDLLSLKKFKTTLIITPKEFIKLLT